MLTHLLANRKGLFPPLENALQWAKAKSLRQLRPSLLLCAAENLSVIGETRQAFQMLDDARLTMGRRTMGRGLARRPGRRLFQQRKVNDGEIALRGDGLHANRLAAALPYRIGRRHVRGGHGHAA